MSGVDERQSLLWARQFNGVAGQSYDATTVTRRAVGIAVAVTVGFVPLGVVAIAAGHPRPMAAATSVAAFLGTFGLHVLHSLPALRWSRERWRGWTLAAQGVLGFLPVPLAGIVWPGMAGYFAGSLLLMVRGTSGRILAALTAAGVSAAGLGRGDPWTRSLYAGGATGVMALAVYGVARLAELVARAHHQRETLAWKAVDQERRRYARDLHDLLGYSLSAISLKGDLAQRLVHVHPERTREELDGLLGVARAALTDVRAVAHGYSTLSLTGEAESARSVLAAADVRAVVDIRHECSGSVGTVLATVLREGVTNLIRHSKATECRIEIRRAEGGFVRLTLANDGIRTEQPRLCQGGGAGLVNLAERMEAVGGRLTVDRDERGWYRVVAEAPDSPS
ncbi:histidine kinase [Streptomyces sp. NPDC002896]|uniref:sensor histidine kinase n=1 Tax=Streptomyces sp. NPDC002896 TaxID=3154438 RepID=UPI0033172E30